MNYDKLTKTLRQHGVSCVRAYGKYCSICDEAATALSTLQAENEKLRSEVERQRRSADDRKHLYENAERAYMASNGAWMRHDGFPWEVDAWMPMPDRRPPEAKDNNVPINEPLTIEELREMNGEPVYLIVDDGYEPLEMWALIDVPEEDHIVLINNIGGRSAYYSDDDLERDHITVYRRPPEGEEDT